MKITDKIVTSVTLPQHTNVLWHNPETGELKMFGDSGWEVVGGNPDEGGGSPALVPVTHSELVTLRNKSKLIPGQLYRITDYVATTTDPESRSADHPFDIIVTADSENVLNENARAIKHEGDTYFADCKLEAWELKYCLDNDTNKYAWADPTNGKGVIFQMIDEHNNECPYDFKNIQFKRWAITDITSNKLTTDSDIGLKNLYCKTQNGGKYFATKGLYGNWVPQSGIDIEWVIDENDYVWYYTFHGLSSNDGETISGQYDMSTKVFKLSDECLQYLENNGYGSNTQDMCKENHIQPAYYEDFGDDEYFKGRMVLNNIVFVNGLSYCYYIEDEGYGYWTIRVGRCCDNKFGVNCKYNTFGNNCEGNTFGNICWCNTFGDDCSNNTFGNDFNHNTFGGVDNNTFGNYFHHNTFESCSYNKFGNYFQYNIFGNDFVYNTFGNDCSNNTFGNSCLYNTFGNDCSNNTFGNYFDHNTFGNSCSGNTFGNSCDYNTFGNSCSGNTFGNGYIRQCRFGDGVRYCTISGYKNLEGYGIYYYISNIIVLNGTIGQDGQLLELNQNQMFNTHNFKQYDDLAPQIVCGFSVNENNVMTYIAKYYFDAALG